MGRSPAMPPAKRRSPQSVAKTSRSRLPTAARERQVMSFLSAIRVALDALLVHKGRSVLTSLGIVIGISAVIAMVSAGEGARFLLEDRLASLGRNLIMVRPGSPMAQVSLASTP